MLVDGIASLIESSVRFALFPFCLRFHHRSLAARIDERAREKYICSRESRETWLAIDACAYISSPPRRLFTPALPTRRFVPVFEVSVSVLRVSSTYRDDIKSIYFCLKMVVFDMPPPPLSSSLFVIDSACATWQLRITPNDES